LGEKGEKGLMYMIKIKKHLEKKNAKQDSTRQWEKGSWAAREGSVG